MTDESHAASIARIERALARIETASQRGPARDARLRERVQIALTSLDVVIARMSAKADS